jgi:hypothetical protein
MEKMLVRKKGDEKKLESWEARRLEGEEAVILP